MGTLRRIYTSIRRIYTTLRRINTTLRRIYTTTTPEELEVALNNMSNLCINNNYPKNSTKILLINDQFT